MQKAFFLLNRSQEETMSNKADYLMALEAAIVIKHKCRPNHIETVFVREKTTDNETVWEGPVETFNLTGHKEAKSCYAWRHADPRGPVKIFAVLENQFIDSPRKAVQSALFTDALPPVNKITRELKYIREQLEDCKNIIHRIRMKVDISIEQSTEVKIIYRDPVPLN